MARFSDLPNEIVLSIICLTAPDSIESLALVSKTLRKLGSACLEAHLSWKRAYSVYECGQPEKTLRNLLKDIFNNSIIASYVRELKVNGWRHEWNDDDDASEILHLYSERMIARFLSAASEGASEVIADKSQMAKDINSGDEDPILALLLLILPNLQTLKLEDTGETQTYLFQLLKRIANAKLSEAPLAKLTHVQIMSKEAMGLCDLRLVADFARLPSLRSLCGWEIWNDDEDD